MSDRNGFVGWWNPGPTAGLLVCVLGTVIILNVLCLVVYLVGSGGF